MDILKKMPVKEQDLQEGATSFKEVCLRYNQEEVQEKAQCYTNYKNVRCIQGCSVVINIPKFIPGVGGGKFEDAANAIAEFNAPPTVCGRVCPQESQCEGKYVRDIKGEPTSIGRLECFVADWSKERGFIPTGPDKTSGVKVAVISSGPAGLTRAGGLAKMGYKVTVFEVLHESGGVPTYGILESRLPKPGVVQPEVDNMRKLGVRIETNVIIGRPTTIDEPMGEEGFKAVFTDSGMGLPEFMGISGENADGAFPANEYLTRNSLMKAFRGDYDTPVYLGKRVTIVGGGNVAMDAARMALCPGAEVHVVYRRSGAEPPARVEEMHYTKEEGIIFSLPTNPVEVLTDDNGWVKGMTVRKMELGESDASDRRRPVGIIGSDYTIDVDAVIMSPGTSPNPLTSSATEGLETNRWKCIIADEPNGETTKEGAYVGGDAVTGVATIILTAEADRVGVGGTDESLRGSK